MVLVALLAYGTILWNGAGFSHPDDVAAAKADLTWDRPLTTLSYSMNHAAGGWMPVNLALHTFAAVLVLFLGGSTVAACLFAAHPMAADAVASVAGRSSLLCACFVLAALLALKHRHYFIWFLIGTTAFFVKEEAANLLILSPLVLLVIGERKKALILTIVSFVIGIGLCGLWFSSMHRAGAVPGLVDVGFDPAPPLKQHIHQFVSALGTYIVPRMLVPVNLSPEPTITYSRPGEALGWAALPLAFPLLPYALASLPDVFLEHRAYLALILAAAVLAYLLHRSAVAAGVLIAVFIVGSYKRAEVYASPISLWEEAVRTSPNNGRANINLATLYAMNGRLDESEWYLKRGIAVAPNIQTGWKNLAFLHIYKNDLASASKVLDAQAEYEASHPIKGK